MTGTVKKIVAERGFGFIRGEDNVEYFFHKQDLHASFDEVCEDLMKGFFVKVSFNIVPSPKGPRAGEVTRMD